MQMGDLDMVLKDSKEDQEMQRMAEEEQQELQQQVCSVRLQAAHGLCKTSKAMPSSNLHTSHCK